MRILINLVVSAIVAYIFIANGWILVDGIQPIIVALTISVMLAVAEVIVGLVFAVVFVGTCGIGCLLLPALLFATGLVALWIVAQVFPETVAIIASREQMLIMAAALSIIRVPSVSASKTES